MVKQKYGSTTMMEAASKQRLHLHQSQMANLDRSVLSDPSKQHTVE